jgi:hypothetical protein
MEENQTQTTPSPREEQEHSRWLVTSTDHRHILGVADSLDSVREMIAAEIARKFLPNELNAVGIALDAIYLSGYDVERVRSWEQPAPAHTPTPIVHDAELLARRNVKLASALYTAKSFISREASTLEGNRLVWEFTELLNNSPKFSLPTTPSEAERALTDALHKQNRRVEELTQKLERIALAGTPIRDGYVLHSATWEEFNHLLSLASPLPSESLPDDNDGTEPS